MPEITFAPIPVAAVEPNRYTDFVTEFLKQDGNTGARIVIEDVAIEEEGKTTQYPQTAKEVRAMQVAMKAVDPSKSVRRFRVETPGNELAGQPKLKPGTLAFWVRVSAPRAASVTDDAE